MKPHRITIILTAVLFLFSCAHSPEDQKMTLKPPDVDIKALAFKGVNEMRRGNYEKARKYFAEGLRYSPTNCHLNFLNSLSYQLEGRGGDTKTLNLAKAGYQMALRFCPNDPWLHYFTGLIQLQENKYLAAEASFRKATLLGDKSNLREYLQEYLIAAYNAGDKTAAKEIAIKLSAIDPHNKMADEIKKVLTTNPQIPSPDLSSLQAEGITRTPSGLVRYYKPLFRKKKPLRKQLIVDAVIILNRQVATKRRGLNLLNGLQLQYGNGTQPGLLATYTHFGTNGWGRYANDTTVDDVFNGSFPQVSFSKLITNVISIPAVTYDLNIFNNADEQDEILARPTLVTEDGQTATYFSGRKLILGIQGTETGTIQTFPIGVDMKLTPHFLKDGSINLDVSIGRELLIPSTAITTFQQTAEELSELTHTTVNLHYGETIILSALSETIESESNDRTPILGKIPLVKYLFSDYRKEREQTSVLFLLTPQKYVSFSSPYTLPTEKQLQHYFTRLVDPSTNLNRVMENLHLLQLYNIPLLLTPVFYDPKTIQEALTEEAQMVSNVR